MKLYVPLKQWLVEKFRLNLDFSLPPRFEDMNYLDLLIEARSMMEAFMGELISDGHRELASKVQDKLPIYDEAIMIEEDAEMHDGI